MKTLFTFHFSLFTRRNRRGFGLVEVVVGVAILTIVFLSLATTYHFYLVKSLGNESAVKGAFLLEEGVEAVKVIRDNGWTANIAPLSTATTYYLYYNNTTWVSTTTVQTVDGFSRSFVLSAVNRDNTTKDIVTSGGTLAANTKKVTLTASWFDAGTTTAKSISTYITNLFSN